MSRYTEAYSALVAGLTEVDLLNRCAVRAESVNPVGKRDEVNALCRAATVLLCARLEAYVRRLGEITLTRMVSSQMCRSKLPPRFFYHISKDHIKKLKEATDQDTLAELVFDFLASDNCFWGKSGPFATMPPADRFCRGFANPKFDKVRSFLYRFGHTTYVPDLQRALRANYPSTVNMVDHLVDTRHKIAHGDLATTQTPRDLADMTRIVRTFCRTTDQVFAAWCRWNLSAVR